MTEPKCKLQIANCKLQTRTRVISIGRQAESNATKACLLLLFLTPIGSAQTPFSFEDIEFWVGSGANRAALVIDWHEDSIDPPALAWGYRWDGAAYGSDMLAAIVAADSRLFAKFGGTTDNPITVFGLGYDANADGKFAIDDATTFDASGIAFVADATDGIATTDLGDFYAEGWLAGFWHYGVAAANPFDGGTWADSMLGMASRTLTDGAWDSWAFEMPISFTTYAENPEPADRPSSPGDFNHDGRIDAADYSLWRHTFGSMSDLAADASGNGTVDAADYVIWRDRFAEEVADSSAAVAGNVPEPTTVSLVAFTALPILWRLAPTIQKEKI
jgi:hypothetical protein